MHVNSASVIKNVFALAALFAATTAAQAATYNWTGASSSAWTTATNWSPATVPVLGDTALFGLTNSIISATTDLGGSTVVVGSSTNKDFYNLVPATNAVFQYAVNGATSSYTLQNGTVSLGTSANTNTPTAAFLIGAGVTLNLNAAINSTLATPGSIVYAASTNAILNIGSSASSNGRFLFEALTNGVTATANVNAANFASSVNGRWTVGSTPSGANKQANVTVNINADQKNVSVAGTLNIGDVAPGYEAKMIIRNGAHADWGGRIALGGQGTAAAGIGRLVIGDATTTGYFTNDLLTAGASTIWLKMGAIQNSTGIVDVVNGTWSFPNFGNQGITTQYLPYAASNNAAAMINLYTNGTFSTVVNFAKNTAVFGTVSASFNFYGGTLQADPQINAVQGNNLLDANLPVFVYNGGAILDNNGKAMTINAALQNPGGSTGGLLLIGSGTTTLNGTNGLAGVTLVKQGTLALSSGFGSPSTIVVSNGATLGFNAGTLASNPNVIVTNGGAIGSLSSSGGTAINLNTLTLTNGIANIQFGSSVNDSFNVVSSGGLKINGGKINLYVEGTTSPFSTPGTYTLFNYSGALGGSGVTSLVVNNPADGATYAFADTGSAIKLTIGVNPSLNQWGVDADGNWSTLANWTLNVPNNSGNKALFGSFITTPHTVTADANFTVKEIQFANNNAYTINGPGVITLNSATNAVVDTSIGSHTINADLALATNTLVSAITAQTLTLAGNITATGANTFQVSTNNLGTVAIIGTNSAPVTVNGGTLTVTGSGMLTQPLTLLGGTTFIDSEANLGANPVSLNTNQLFLNGGTLCANGDCTISNPNRGINLGTNGGTFGTASGVYTLTIANPISGNGSLTKTFGSQGVLVLATNNTYTGNTIINQGEVQIGTGGTVGTLGTGTNVTINSGAFLTINRSDLSSLTNALTIVGGGIRNRGTNPITISGPSINASNSAMVLDTETADLILPGNNIINFNGLIKTNANKLTLTGTQSASTTFGRFSVANGNVVVGSGANWTFTNSTTTRTVLLGSAGGLGGSMVVSNGAVLNISGISVGNANNSSDSFFELDGGTVNVLGTAGDVIYLHESGNTVNSYSLTVNSGTLNIPDPGSCVDIGYKGAASFTINGGNVTLNRIGFGAVGSSINSSYALGGISMSSSLTINGGSLNVSNQLELLSDQTANAAVYRANTITVNNGASLRTVAANMTTPGAPVTFNLNGGTLVSLGVGGFGGSLGNFLGGISTVNVGPSSIIDSGSYNLTITNALLDSGGGSLTKLGSGTLALNGANTYTGSTLVSNGTLGGNGSIAGSLTVSGSGTLSPGTSIGTFTVGGSARLFGATFMELNRTNAPATNDLLVVTGTLTGGGTLTVTNLGPALVAGDTFKLFSQPVTGFTSISLPSGYIWTTNLASNGSITVQSVVSSTPPTLSVSQSGNSLNFTWTDASFHLQSQTNLLNAGLSTNWSNFPGGGSSPVNITINPANPAVFFRLSQ